MGYSLVKQPKPDHRWRVSFGAGVLRVSSKLGSSHRTLTTPVEAYAPPCTAHILPFCRGLTNGKLAPKAFLYGSFYLAVGGLLGNLAAFVVLAFAAGDGDLEFDDAVFGVELQGDERFALLLALAHEAVYLFSVQEELAVASGELAFLPGVGVGRDVRPDKEQLTVPYA